MKQHFFMVITMLLLSTIGAWADYDPQNPPDPYASYLLSVSVFPPEAGFVSGGGYFEKEEQISLNTSPCEGYEFLYWTCNGERISSARSFVYTMPEQFVSMVAVYSFNPDIPDDPSFSERYSLYLDTNMPGSCTFNLTSGVKQETGKSVTVSVQNISAGYIFQGWYIGNQKVSETTEFSYRMPSNDVKLTAMFVYDPDVPEDPLFSEHYNLNLETNIPNICTFNLTSETKQIAGTYITVSVQNISADYIFQGWYIENQKVSENTEFSYMMPSYDVTLTALFVHEPETIVKATSYSRLYGESNPKFEYMIERGELIGTPSIICEATATSPVGEYPIVLTKGSITNNNISFTNGTLTIEKAPLKITAKSYTIKQGETLPTFEATYDGFKNNETSQVLMKQPSITTTATSSSAPGEYDITISGAEAQNYEFSYVAGKLTIEAIETMEITPITGSEETSFKETIGNETDLENTVIDNTYYNMNAANGDGYDATEQALVLNSTTTDAQMTAILNAEVGDAAVKENYSGIIFEIPAGKGIITVDAKTVGTHVLNVQVGNSTPTKVQKSERGTADVEYNVNAPTYVYLYASTQSGSAARLDRAGTAGANSVLLYGYKVTIGGTGIQLIDKGQLPIDNYYDLNGRKVKTPRKGVYIINGRKVVVK